MKKPILRGHIHQEAFFVALGACAMLVAKASHPTSFVSAVTYSVGLLLLLGISAIYHRPTWNLRARSLMRRIDHSAIYILIGCSFTPICLLALPEEEGLKLLRIVCVAVVIGIFKSIFWVNAPKWLASMVYVTVGLFVLPYLYQLRGPLGDVGISLLIAGGLLFVAGAVFYALKWPNIFPNIFGYHELFHLMVVIGASLHFIVMYSLIN